MLNHSPENHATYFRCFALARSLAELGDKVTLVCASGKAFDLSIRSRRLSENLKIVTFPRFKYSRYYTGQELRLLLNAFYTLFSRCDVVHAFAPAQPQIGVPAWLAKRGRRLPLVSDWDDLWDGGFAEAHPWPVRKALAFWERRTPLIADRVTAVSDWLIDKAIASGVGPERVRYIPNGCDNQQIKPIARDAARERLGFRAEDELVCAVGNCPAATVEVLLKAFRRTAQARPRLRCVLVGDVELPDWLRFSEPWTDQLVLTGKRPFSDVPLYLGAADILALPMYDHPIERARFPMRLGDYLAAGRPVVSNAVGEVRKVLEQYRCGLVAGPRDDLALAGHMVDLLENRSLAGRLARGARSAAGELDWGILAGQVHDLYTEVTDERLTREPALPA